MPRGRKGTGKSKSNAPTNPNKGLYYVFYGKKNKDFVFKGESIQVVSIDPGMKNLFMRVERRHSPDDIETILTEKIDIKDCASKTCFEQLFDFFDSHKELLLESHMIVVERQLTRSFNAFRISHYIIAYFMSIRKEFLDPNIVIMDISPRNKGNQLGVPKNCKGLLLKKWSILRGTELLECRGDTVGLQSLKKSSKPDDEADSCVQLEALFRLLKLPLTEGFDHDGGPKDLDAIKLGIKQRSQSLRDEKKAARLADKLKNNPPKNPKVKMVKDKVSKPKAVKAAKTVHWGENITNTFDPVDNHPV